jgi:MarR family transcriptional regulator, organic hydroperoxide resistance regulator
MMSNIDVPNYNWVMTSKRKGSHACEAWQLLVRLSFTHRASLPPVAAELDLSPAQCHLLNVIDPERPMPMGQLAGALSCDASNVTGLVDRLETRGLVVRRPSEADRRVKVLGLTPLGVKVRMVLLERMTAPPATLQRLTVAEQRALASLLRRLME